MKKKLPYIQIALLIGVIVMSLLLPKLAIAAAIAVGLYNGIIFEMEYIKKRQAIHKEKVGRENESDSCLGTLE